MIAAMDPMPAPDRLPDPLARDRSARLELAPKPVFDASADAAPDEIVVRGRSSYVRMQSLADPKAPWLLRIAFVTMYAMLVALAAHQLTGFGGSDSHELFNVWFNNLIFVGAGLATAWRAFAVPSERRAWAVVATALLVYFGGDLVWTTFYADSDAWVTFADAFYLAFVPLMFLGIAMLVRTRIQRFELDRWIDGVAAALLVAAPGVILILEPTIRQSEGPLLAKVVTTAYPLSDIVLLGAVVGVIALAGWRPGRAWITLGIGLACFVAADAFYSVENLTGTYSLGGAYEFLWPTAGLLIATSAWMRPLRHVEVHAWGWRAIALPVLCQVAPICLMLLKDEPPSEQLLMSSVLTIVIVQLVVTRPRRPAHLA